MTKRALFLASSAFVLATAALPGRAAAEFWPPIMRDVVDAPTFDALTESAPDSVPGEIVVDIKDDLSEEQIQALGNEFHIALRDNSPGVKDDGKVEIADVDPSDVSDLVARLSADPRVEAVEPAGIAKILWTPNDPK